MPENCDRKIPKTGVNTERTTDRRGRTVQAQVFSGKGKSRAAAPSRRAVFCQTIGLKS
jgi:hypothetical protein